MGLFLKCINQTRKPEGTLGKLMLKGMNFGHAKTADWGMSQLEAAGTEHSIGELRSRVIMSCRLKLYRGF